MIGIEEKEKRRNDNPYSKPIDMNKLHRLYGFIRKLNKISGDWTYFPLDMLYSMAKAFITREKKLSDIKALKYIKRSRCSWVYQFIKAADASLKKEQTYLFRSKQTLSLYLQILVDRGYIERIEIKKKFFYADRRIIKHNVPHKETLVKMKEVVRNFRNKTKKNKHNLPLGGKKRLMEERFGKRRVGRPTKEEARQRLEAIKKFERVKRIYEMKRRIEMSRKKGMHIHPYRYDVFGGVEQHPINEYQRQRFTDENYLESYPRPKKKNSENINLTKNNISTTRYSPPNSYQNSQIREEIKHMDFSYKENFEGIPSSVQRKMSLKETNTHERDLYILRERERIMREYPPTEVFGLPIPEETIDKYNLPRRPYEDRREGYIPQIPTQEEINQLPRRIRNLMLSSRNRK